MQLPEKLVNEGYLIVSDYGNGGQSKTFELNKEGVRFLLKIPSQQKLSKEQKFRFEQEAEALKLLSGNGAPKIYDFNFENEKPYILMEFIEGKTLTEIVNGKPLELNRAIEIIFKILEILKEVHSIGLVHRDIKPDNLIIKENGDVILIDYGLCKIDLEDNAFQTSEGKELGNRFLRLPELGRGEKVSSSVSDVTFVIGLLFFMVYAQSPNILLDENRKMPHQRIDAKDGDEKINWLTYTFDKGFSYNISERFQNTDELKNFIIEQRDKNEEYEFENVSDHFSKFISSGNFKNRDEILQSIREAQSRFLAGMSKNINDDLSYAGSGPEIIFENNTIFTDFVILRRGSSNPSSGLKIVSRLNDDLTEITYRTEVNGRLIEEGLHGSVEVSRINEDYFRFGEKCGKFAVIDLIEMYKRI